MLEFVKAHMPESWQRYAHHAEIVLIKPGQTPRPFEDAIAQLILPRVREASAKAKAEHAAIVHQLKTLLLGYDVVADDLNRKCVPLERRHWADAIFELENSALRHGDQRWTNVEVRGKSLSSPSRPSVGPSAALMSRHRGAKTIDDAKYVAEFLRLQAKNPNLSMNAFVLKRAAEIPGAGTPASKARRLQRRVQKPL